MRVIKAGILLLLFLPGLAAAQLSGQVESVGFEGCFRPNCWTPMVISIDPETSANAQYQIHVKLQDMDRDLAIYSRVISVTGASEGRKNTQKFRMYFIPPPTDGGIPDASDPGAFDALQQRVRVSVYTDTAVPKWIVDLPWTKLSVQNIDAKPVYGPTRGAKLILAVGSGSDRAKYAEAGGLLGTTEDVDMVQVRTTDLPENVLGYDAVDAIVWMDADPAELVGAGDEKRRALEAYIQRGGKLVICQPAEWQKTLGFGDLLPVKIDGVEEKDDLMPLRRMAMPKGIDASDLPPVYADPFANLRPPFRFARAIAKPDTVVSEWITWKSPDDVSPYIVRAQHGLGTITWVAQDLGDPVFEGGPRQRATIGWYNVWDRVFDWQNTPVPISNAIRESVRAAFERGFVMDLGKSLSNTSMDLQSKSAWLITLAILVFICYWVLAGPGAFTFLATRKMAHLSWFVYGLSALIATFLTVAIVKLVLRGPPELRHFSLVQIAPDYPALVTSRFGLYIPRDGEQRLELSDVTPGAVTSISAFPIHPSFLSNVADDSGPEYSVPVVDAASAHPAALSFPYRSTLKKFEATWVGELSGKVVGLVKLAPSPTYIEGSLVNDTGTTLNNVYIAFHYPSVEAFVNGDWLLYFPTWEPGVRLDLNRQFNQNEEGGRLLFGWTDNPDGRHRVRGRIQQDWERFWMERIQPGPMNEAYDDTNSSFSQTFVIFSFYDRLVPTKNQANKPPSRVDLLRRGARQMDLSSALSAGSLIVLAQANGPLPMPLKVDGSAVSGDGRIFYQFVLPLDHSAVASTTQPTTQRAAE